MKKHNVIKMAASEQISNTNNTTNSHKKHMKKKNADGGANTTNAYKVTSKGRFEKLVNSPNASEFASEIGFIGKEREDYFHLLYLENLPVTNYEAWKSWRLRLGWEISEIAGDKGGNQSTVWDVVTALNTLIMKGEWVEDGNTVHGDVNSLVLHKTWSNIVEQVRNIIKGFNFDEKFEDEVTDKVFGLNFDNPYAA